MDSTPTVGAAWSMYSPTNLSETFQDDLFFGTEGVYRSGVAHDLRMMSNVDIFLEAKQVLHVFSFGIKRSLAIWSLLKGCSSITYQMGSQLLCLFGH